MTSGEALLFEGAPIHQTYAVHLRTMTPLYPRYRFFLGGINLCSDLSNWRIFKSLG